MTLLNTLNHPNLSLIPLILLTPILHQTISLYNQNTFSDKNLNPNQNILSKLLKLFLNLLPSKPHRLLNLKIYFDRYITEK